MPSNFKNFKTKFKALPVLVLRTWQILEAPDLTDFEKIVIGKSADISNTKAEHFVILFLMKD